MDMSNDTRWRLLLGLGAVPASFVVACSLLETRQARLQEKADDMSTRSLLNHSSHHEQFSHHADGDIVSTTNSSSISSTQSPLIAGGKPLSLGANAAAADQPGSLNSSKNSSFSHNLSRGVVGGVGGGGGSQKREMAGANYQAPREANTLEYHLKQRSTWIKLLVTGGGWFIYDVAYCK
jgi:hypothetical protein